MLEQFLRTVRRGERELTLDAADLSAEQRQLVVDTAKALGLNVAGTRRWLLIRELRS